MIASETVSALDVAGSLPLLRFWMRRYYGRLSPDLLDELLAETALELVGRHRRNPSLRVSKWKLLDFASREALRRVFRNAGSGAEFSSDRSDELATPPNQFDAERLRERIADELVEEALEEISRDTSDERRARDRETREALGTSPDPLAIRWPKSRSGHRAEGFS